MVKGKVVMKQLSILQCLNDAKDELLALAEEMDSWRSNMEGTNLEFTSKYEMVSECADILEEQLSLLEDVVSSIEDLTKFNLEEIAEVTVYESKRPSRRDRLDMVIAYLTAARDELQEQVDEIREKIDEIESAENVTPEQEKEKEELEAEADEMENQLGELENIISELEGAEFPGMY